VAELKQNTLLDFKKSIARRSYRLSGILEAAKGFPRLKAYKHLPALRAELAAHQSKCFGKRVEDNADVA
jgi:hypothetical protein